MRRAIHRKNSPPAVIATWVMACWLCGCGTIDSQVSYWSPELDATDRPSLLVFGGLARDVDWAGLMLGGDRWANPEILVLFPAWVIDVPLSLVADTALLPMTLVQQLFAYFD